MACWGDEVYESQHTACHGKACQRGRFSSGLVLGLVRPRDREDATRPPRVPTASGLLTIPWGITYREFALFAPLPHRFSTESDLP